MGGRHQDDPAAGNGRPTGDVGYPRRRPGGSPLTGLRAIVDAIARAGLLVGPPSSWPTLSGVADDSRRVTAGALFCAVSGTTQDGHAFLSEAVRRGAAAVLVTRVPELPIPAVAVRDSRAATAIAAATWYGWPGRHLRLVGVTGTNGKSTTVSLIRHLLNRDGTAGVIGTLGAFDGAGAPVGPDVGLTTPGAVQLQAILANMRERGVTAVAMEASSHALDQERLYGLPLAAAVYTNLTHDHLDYHKDARSYLAAKLRLSTLLNDRGVEIVNADAPSWNALPRDARLRRVTYGVRQGDVSAGDVRMGPEGTTLSIQFGAHREGGRLPLLGEFNVSNALAATAAAWGLGGVPEEIVSRLADAPQVPGRMERLAHEEFTVLRDYAHTPDALERAIRALRPLTRGRLVVLFGCGGDRDRRKRPVMGRIAARGADLAIVTSDNPRTEDPDAIIDEIEEGMRDVAHWRITDRRDAIHRALQWLKTGDCLLLAGKGHETYQVIGTDRFPFDEREIVQSALSHRTGA